MGYKPYKKDQKETTEKSAEPNYQTELAVAKARNEEIEKRLAEKAAEYDRREKERADYERQRVEQQEQYNRQQYQQNNDTTRAMIDLGITEEDVAANPTGVLQRVQDYMNAMYQEQQTNVGRAGQVITGLAEDNHRLKVEALAGKDFYEYARSDVESFYKQNPDKKIPGTPDYVSPQEVYERMVGKNWQSYYDKKAEDGRKKEETNPTYVPPTTQYIENAPRPNTPSGPNIHRKKKEEVTLSPDEQAIFEHYNRLEPGLFPGGAAEWRAISSGKVLPKKVGGASDWQRGVPSDYQESTSTEE